MIIEKISDKSANFKGKFIFAENLTKKEIKQHTLKKSNGLKNK